MALALTRRDHSASEHRAAAGRVKDANQARSLLAIALILEDANSYCLYKTARKRIRAISRSFFNDFLEPTFGPPCLYAAPIR